MAANVLLIVDMVTVLGTAAGGGYLASRLGQPVLMGYLLAGLIVGPSGLKLIPSPEEIEVLSKIGVALLLFALGVEFSLGDLLKVRRIALGGGTLQILLTILLAGGLAFAIGVVKTVPAAVFLGAALSLSSTALVLKSLMERNEVQTAHGQVMLGILIVQDIGLGFMLAVLPALTEPAGALVQGLLLALVKAALFFAGAAIAGLYVVPPLMKRIARTGSQELFVLSVVVLCLGVALLTNILGLGIEMGAFVAGLMISQVEYSDQALHSILPLRDVFATLFFASIGMLIDPLFLLSHAGTLVSLVAVVMLGKAIIIAPLVALFGYPLKTALTVGLGINQIGEFSFVLSGVASKLGLFSSELYGLTVGTTAITLLLTPFLLKLTPFLFHQLESVPKLGRWLRAGQYPKASFIPEHLTDHCIVAGYGRVGETLVRLLRSRGYPVLVIDNDEATLQLLRERKIPYVYGDASSELVLQKAKLNHAQALAIALTDPAATRLALKRAASIAPDLDITVRAHANQEIDTLYQLGAKEVVQPEFEAALEMGAHVLLNLGGEVSGVLQSIQSHRADRYRDILPDRFETLASTNFGEAMVGLDGNWRVLAKGSALVGQTLAQANIRQMTGATIMAIRRGRQLLRYPDPQTVLTEGDRLLVVGDAQEQAAFERLFG
ncbi:cation:proton antiporter [Altericista sp. CCNU0014]|uniref:cation:proton antiporter domain-containing protein n=1 Tax=Altericista sp. CCNU0014 TaxID=3082949 RepID=UPI0038508F9A